MDGHRFDDLTRTLARGTSRRALLRGLAGAVAGGLAGLRLDEARAARQANGAPCARATDCASLKCVDGVCCNSACIGQCESCASGTCLPVSGAPVGNRPACPGGGPCMATCDGVTRNRCAAFPGSDLPCGVATCADGWLTTYACGGNGACTPITTSCAPYGCTADGTACATGCTSHDQCPGSSHCAADGRCVGDQPLGASCADGAECQHGVCADGVCCVEPCDGPCVACNVPGNAGFCTATVGVSCDDGDPCTTNDACQNNGDCEGTPIACQPRGVCETATCNPATGACDYRMATGVACREAAGPCESPGVCDGVSPDCPPNALLDASVVCRPAHCAEELAVPATTCDGATAACPSPPPGESCAADVCSGATEATITTCEGAGVCVARTVDCGLYLCVDGACPTTCQTSDDCLGSAHCADGACVPDRTVGEACTGPDQCPDARCIDGFCCDSACDGGCAACDVPGGEGTCQADPRQDGQACPAPAGGVCAAGACVCPDSARECGGACVAIAEGGCCVDADCTAEAPVCQQPACDQTTHTCRVVNWDFAAHGGDDPRCDSQGDACTNSFCSGGICFGLPEQCLHLACETFIRCDPQLGCIFEPVVCEPRNPCETAHCDPLRGCVFESVCAAGEVCCGGTACVAEARCCSDGTSCPVGQFCGEAEGQRRCCPDGTTFCKEPLGTYVCTSLDATSCDGFCCFGPCCDGVCCGFRDDCCPTGGGDRVCCANGCNFDGGGCCPPGELSCGGTCYDPDELCCFDGTIEGTCGGECCEGNRECCHEDFFDSDPSCCPSDEPYCCTASFLGLDVCCSHPCNEFGFC